jgi:hypothetical protein
VSVAVFQTSVAQISFAPLSDQRVSCRPSMETLSTCFPALTTSNVQEILNLELDLPKGQQ